MKKSILQHVKKWSVDGEKRKKIAFHFVLLSLNRTFVLRSATQAFFCVVTERIMRHHYKFGVVLLTLLMIMPMNMAARRKKTVYLKTETGATAYYRGEVDDQDQPAGQGEFVVEAGNAGYACRGTEVMHLTGNVAVCRMPSLSSIHSQHSSSVVCSAM